MCPTHPGKPHTSIVPKHLYLSHLGRLLRRHFRLSKGACLSSAAAFLHPGCRLSRRSVLARMPRSWPPHGSLRTWLRSGRDLRSSFFSGHAVLTLQAEIVACAGTLVLCLARSRPEPLSNGVARSGQGRRYVIRTTLAADLPASRKPNLDDAWAHVERCRDGFRPKLIATDPSRAVPIIRARRFPC